MTMTMIDRFLNETQSLEWKKNEENGREWERAIGNGEQEKKIKIDVVMY